MSQKVFNVALETGRTSAQIVKGPFKLICSKCETWYSGQHFKAGELCGDRTVTKPGPCPGLLVDLALAVEAMNVANETGRTPSELAAERAELVATLEELRDELFAKISDKHDPKTANSWPEIQRADAILAKVKK